MCPLTFSKFLEINKKIKLYFTIEENIAMRSVVLSKTDLSKICPDPPTGGVKG
jgi:hypothetical protein